MHADGNALGTIVTVVISIVAAAGLIAALLIAFLMWRYRLPPRALFAMVGALIYLVSPIDVLPEVLLGPIGLLDDAGVTAGTAIFIYKLIQTRKRLIEAGVMGPGVSAPRRLRRGGYSGTGT